MSLALTASTLIPPLRANPLDTIIHTAGRKLCALQMTRLRGEADKGDAQALTRDLLDISRIVDEAILAIGREAKAHIGHDVDLSLFADQLSSALEGNALFNLCEAVETREEEIEAAIGDTRYSLAREYAA
jgi:hypothetical protein